MVLVEGGAIAGASRGNRYIDPGVAFAMDLALGRAERDAADLAFRIRTTLRTVGATSNAPVRVETSAVWSVGWRDDIRHRLTLLRGGVPGPVAPWGPGGIALPAIASPVGAAASYLAFPDLEVAWHEWIFGPDEIWDETRGARVLHGTAFSALGTTALIDTVRTHRAWVRRYRGWRQMTPGLQRVSEAFENRATVTRVFSETGRYDGPLRYATGEAGAVAHVLLDSPAVKVFGDVVTVVGVVGDVRTVVGPSPYDGAREVADRTIAGASAIAGSATIAAGLGVLSVTPAGWVAIGAVGAGAAVWAAGNYIYDNREAIAEKAGEFTDAVDRAADWAEEALADVGQDVLREAWDAGRTISTGLDRAGDLLTDGLDGLGDVITFWD